MTSEQVDFKLKEVLIDFEDKTIHDTSQLDVPVSTLEGKTQKEIYNMAPELTFGFLLSSMLSGAIKPKDPSEAAKLYRLAAKVHNKELTAGGIWPIEEQEVIKPGKKVTVGRFSLKAFEVEHSLLAPAVSYRIEAGKHTIFYVTELVYIYEQRKALKKISLYIGDGALPGKRYFISVTTSGVYWYQGGNVDQIATGLDNFSQMHTYRLAVRADGIVQIYRDLDLLAVRKADFGIDPLISADGSYLQFGDGASSSETDFDVSHIAIDLQGPFDSEACVVGFNDLVWFAGDWLNNDLHCEANLDKAGRVDFADYSILADDWHQQCPNGWPVQWDD